MSADDQWTVRRVLDWTIGHLKKHGSETPRLDAEILLAHARGCKRIELYTRFEENLSEPERSAMRELVRRRATLEPVAYLVGHREFFGLDFQVTADVLIPRPDTETLVVELLEAAKAFPSPRILDVGTGSGCIAVSTAVNLPAAQLTAIDLSPAALDVARGNAERHKVADRVRFLEGDLLGPLDQSDRFEIIASNPPYVVEAELQDLQTDVRKYEPKLALIGGGPQGLAVIERLISQAATHLVPGGSLLMEIAPEQTSAVRQLLEHSGRYEGFRVTRDLGGDPRVVQVKRVSEISHVA